MSLFGQANNSQPSGGGLFGSNTAQNTSGGSSLFGAKPATSTAGGGLFGAAPAPQNTGTSGGLFGSNNTAQNTGTGSGLFGSSTANQPTTSGGLFGSNANRNTGTGGGLFGSSTANQPGTGSGLFGASTTNQPNTTGGLSGATAPGAASGTGLFGSNANQAGNTNSGSLFGSSVPNAQPTQPQSTYSLSAFASSTQAQPTAASNFGAGAISTNQSQNAAPQSLRSSLFHPDMVTVGNAGHTMSHAKLQRLQYSGVSTTPNEKNVPDQIKTVKEKWDPRPEDGSRSETILRTYFYNAVDKAYAPFYYPQPGEAEKSWEEALSRKPELPQVEGQAESGQTYVPVECIGFEQLGVRVRNQAETVLAMRNRLHEMNNSLSAIMDAHQQRITVKIAAAKRQHQVLSQRCLRLAVKVQVLRNRGYSLDGAEEGLRKKLQALEKDVMDPASFGREDEIWARMVSLRERSRWLEEEGKRVAAQVGGQSAPGGSIRTTNGSGVPEEVLAKTRTILKDYGDQLGHLNKELEDIEKEYKGWQGTQNA